MKSKSWIINLLIEILILIFIIMMIVLILNSMETQFNEDCKKQNYQGIKSYWDVDIDCSQFYQIKERVTS